jgi:hypothetical protein
MLHKITDYRSQMVSFSLFSHGHGRSWGNTSANARSRLRKSASDAFRLISATCSRSPRVTVTHWSTFTVCLRCVVFLRHAYRFKSRRLDGLVSCARLPSCLSRARQGTPLEAGRGGRSVWAISEHRTFCLTLYCKLICILHVCLSSTCPCAQAGSGILTHSHTHTHAAIASRHTGASHSGPASAISAKQIADRV